MGNTVGSREAEKLSEQQKEILVGKLLGDGCLEINGFNPRLKIDQTRAQKEYVFWLYRKFTSIVGRKPYVNKFFDKRFNKIYYHWRFATKSLSIFKHWHRTFYRGKVKIVPKNIFDLLTPLSLAVWYMDDGYRRRDCNGVYLCTSAYNISEQKLLQNALERKFSLKSRLHYAAGNVKIYIPASHGKFFCKIIKKYMLPGFSYKLL